MQECEIKIKKIQKNKIKNFEARIVTKKNYYAIAINFIMRI